MAERHDRKTTECPHNEGVACVKTADCATCGWNPDVISRREEAIREMYGIKNEEE